ncbi:methyltransferase family protein [Salinarimonas chemoclinalis]|uniref:methyltransferase family protein n=1 Tax=Salinarimonas chemoclinalis TaxID=3241599 RepID=UPI00355915ED
MALTSALPHRSALVAGAAWAATFGLALALAPRLAADLAGPSPRLLALAGAGALFIGLVALLQREMGLALRASSFGDPRRLVTSGSFAVSRNPIYLAFLIPLASFALWSPLAAGAGIGLYLAAMTLLVVRPEERALAEAFGDEFEAWARRTPRWIGVPGRPKREIGRDVAGA